jgi:hypothetical protein
MPTMRVDLWGAMFLSIAAACLMGAVALALR